MIYSLPLGFAFIHVPRTGGVSITRAIAASCIEHCVCDMGPRRHATAADLAGEIGERWSSLYRFAVVRSPWRLIESDYRLCLRDAASLASHPAHPVGAHWRERIKGAARGTFAEFVEREYLSGQVQPGGIWATWGGPGVEAVRHDQLGDYWPDLSRRLGAAHRLAHANAAPWDRPTWDASTIERVRALCAGDFERFGFEGTP